MDMEESRETSLCVKPQASTRVEVTIERAVNLWDVGPLKHAPDAYVEVSVGECRERTKTVKRGHFPEWHESFVFYCDPSATITMDVYASRTAHKDTQLGHISENIDSFASTAGNYVQTREIAPRSELRFTVKVTAGILNEVVIDSTVDAAEIDIHRMDAAPSKLADRVDSSEAPTEVIETIGNAVSPISALLEGLDVFCEIMDGIAEVHPYAKTAWNILSSVYKMYRQQLDADNNVRELFTEMTALYNAMNELKHQEGGEIRAMAKSQEALLLRITKETKECCEFIEKYTSRRFVSRMARNALSTDGQRVKDYCDSFRKLQSEFHSALQWGIHLMSARTLDGQQSLAMSSFLQSLPCAERASVLDLPPCLPQTRTEVFPEIRSWVNANDGQQVFLLTGPSGSGKSAIASSVARYCKGNNSLGASFAFRRGQPDRTANKLFPTIARDLAEFNEAICKKLYNLVRNNTALRETGDLELQFKTYLVDSVAEVTAAGTVVVVIDALDEGGDPETRSLLLQLLAERPSELFPQLRFRFFITCRPEYDILKFTNHPGVHWKKLDDMPSTNQDISRYIRWRLTSPNGFMLDGIDQSHCDQLARASQGLFQFASVACTIIIGNGKGGLTPQERYERLIKGTAADGKGLLDNLYRNILSQLFSSEDPEVIARFKTVMGLVLASFEPLSTGDINALLKALKGDGGNFDAKVVLGYLGSLLSGVSTMNDPIVPLHTSFHDFLTEPLRSDNLSVNLSDAHKQLAAASLRIMHVKLTFNICKLPTSYSKNCDIPGLAERIKQYIPSYLSYACRSWAQHLSHSSLVALDDEFSRLMKIFMTKALLSWLETLSLLNAVQSTRSTLTGLEKLTSNHGELGCLLNDTLAFLTVFSRAISDSAPHVYLSALSFAPPNSLVSKHFIAQFPNTLQVCNPLLSWPDLQTVMQHGQEVWAVSVSPDDQYIASGCRDGTVWLWNAYSGMLIHGPLSGHQTCIKSITFSKNSTLLTTSSYDGAVCLWNVSKGEIIREPLARDPRSTVLAVVFASLDSHNLSASYIQRHGIIVRTWDAEPSIAQATQASSAAMISSHTFHYDSVSCGAFSSDGEHFAFGGRDGSVILWTIAHGEECHRNVLSGHPDTVTCVAFSAESRYLASGSDDKTIRIWDVKMQEAVGAPLIGHTDYIHSVVFSPQDSKCVASGGLDSIRIWSIAAAGHQLIRVIRNNSVMALAYTANGANLVLGHPDGTVRMWHADEADGPENMEQIQSGQVWAICFSPDGMSIVSGSNGPSSNFQVWDVATGKVLHNPSTTGRSTYRTACAIAFSHDGTRLAVSVSDKGVRWRDSKTYKVIGDRVYTQAGWIYAVGFTRDDKQLIVIGKRGVRLFDTQTGELALNSQLEDQLSNVYVGTISADGSLVACGVQGMTCTLVRVWDLKLTCTARCDFTLEGRKSVNRHTHMTFSPDGTSLLIAIDSESIITRADILTGNTAKWKTIDGSFIVHLTSSLAGNYVAAGTGDGSIYVWHYETGALVARFVLPERGSVTAVTFSPDARQVAGGTYEGSLRLWDMPTKNNGAISSVELILFSSEREHALSNADGLFNSFRPSSTDGRRPIIQLGDDGWVKATVYSDLGDDSRLLFWVPPHYSQRLTILGRLPMNHLDPIHIDLRKLAHGLDWSHCYVPTSITS